MIKVKENGHWVSIVSLFTSWVHFSEEILLESCYTKSSVNLPQMLHVWKIYRTYIYHNLSQM